MYTNNKIISTTISLQAKLDQDNSPQIQAPAV